MSDRSPWRSPKTAKQCELHDYADFAQEFLQRNFSYRSDYAETETRITAKPQNGQLEKEGLAGRWGLSFPHPANRCAAHKSGAMVAMRITRCITDRDRRHLRTG